MMTDNAKQVSETIHPGQTTITALREGLTDLRQLALQQRESKTSTQDLSEHLSYLQELLRNLEREWKAQALEQDELTALYDVSQAIGSTLDLSVVLNEVMDQIIHLTGAERSLLMLVDPETKELELKAARNVDRETMDSSSFEISRSVTNQVANTGQPIITTNAQMDPRFRTKESVIGYKLRSILCVPLKVRGRVTGVIYADNRILTGIFSDRDLDLLTAFASQAAVAIENARLFKSVTDAKTLMDNIFASITSGVITTDMQKQITLFNRAAERILQISENSVNGLSFKKVLPELAEALQLAIERVETHKEPVVDLEKELPPSNGNAIKLRTNLSPLKNTNGKMQGIAIVLDDLTEKRRLEAREKLFQRYLPPAVIDRLPADPEQLKLGGQRQEITSLFADIRGFTSFSRQHDPEILVEVLNQYLAIGADAVLSEEGTLDKIMGDCVVAFFNAPLFQPDHVLRAIRAAIKIQRGVALLHENLPANHRLFYGVGISVGDAVVGNIGTEKQMNYTAIGSIVNSASRLQDSAAPGQILLTHQAYQRVQHNVKVQPISSVRIAGKDSSLKVYEVLDLV